MVARVVHISNIHSPEDTRIFHKECVSLAQAGYEVVYLCTVSALREQAGVKLHPIPAHIPFRKAPNENLRRRRLIFKQALALEAAIYHLHDPELLSVGFWLKKAGYKVVFDAHEYYPDQVKTVRTALGPVYTCAKSLYMHWLWRKACKNLDGFVAATQYIANKLPAGRTVVAANYPFLKQLLFETVAVQRQAAAIYVGGLSHKRGLKTLVEAMQYVRAPQARLWLAGWWLEPELENQLKKLSGWQKVDFQGRLSYVETLKVLQKATVGIFVPEPSTHVMHAYPVKVFEYMAYGLPIIISDFPQWRDLFAAWHCALFVPPNNPQALAAAIDQLLREPTTAQQMGNNGLQAVYKRYNWELEKEQLLRLYQKLV